MKTIHPAIAEHVMEENERLRGLLRDTASVAITMLYDSHKDDVLAEFKLPELEAVVEASRHLQDARVERVYRAAWDAALSQQAEPAPAQDERDSVIAHIELCITNLKAEHQTNPRVIAEVLYNIGYSRATRPAQTDQQPVAWRRLEADDNERASWSYYSGPVEGGLPVYAAPIAQAAPQPEQSGLYTCIGKGGSYELIGRATTAGTLKVTGRFADELIVYRDTESSALYCRAPGDFRLRMARAALSTQGTGK